MSKKKVNEEETLHYRCCHVCGAVSSGENPILQCEKCNKVMAPFFYFDVRDGCTYTDDRFHEKKLTKSGERAPVQGLTVYW